MQKKKNTKKTSIEDQKKKNKGKCSDGLYREVGFLQSSWILGLMQCGEFGNEGQILNRGWKAMVPVICNSLPLSFPNGSLSVFAYQSACGGVVMKISSAEGGRVIFAILFWHFGRGIAFLFLNE